MALTLRADAFTFSTFTLGAGFLTFSIIFWTSFFTTLEAGGGGGGDLSRSASLASAAASTVVVGVAEGAPVLASASCLDADELRRAAAVLTSTGSAREV